MYYIIYIFASQYELVPRNKNFLRNSKHIKLSYINNLVCIITKISCSLICNL